MWLSVDLKVFFLLQMDEIFPPEEDELLGTPLKAVEQVKEKEKETEEKKEKGNEPEKKKRGRPPKEKPASIPGSK